jgi:hypothetical protein
MGSPRWKILPEFFRRLPTGDKRFAVLPGLAHGTSLGLRRHLLWMTVADFLRDEEVGAQGS